MASYADQMATIGADADAAIAAKGQQPATTAQADAARATGAAADTALANTAPPPPKPATGFPGDVAVGHVRWGISIPISGQSVPYGSHRTYYQGSQNDFNRAWNTVQADHAADMVPWLSFKPAGGWQAAAGGSMDAQASGFFGQCAKASKPVIVTFGHEPVDVKGNLDDSGGPTQHLAWNRRMKGLIVKAGAGSVVALTQIHMAMCYTSLGASAMSAWWDNAVYDFLSVDAYSSAASMRGHKGLEAAARFAVAKGKPKLGIGEWGVHGDANGINDTYAYFLAPIQGAQLVIADQWNSNANATDWRLSAVQIPAFIACAKKPTSVQASEV